MSSSAIDIFGNQVDNFKNKFINGNFDFWQRQRGIASAYNIASTASDINSFVPDRWFITGEASGSDTYTASVQRKTHTLGGASKILSIPKYYCDFSGVVTENSTGNQTQIGLAQRIEGVRTLAGKQVTVSFWVKGSVDGYASVRVSQKFGSGGSPTTQVNVGQREFAVATSWTQVIFTFNMPDVPTGAVIGNRLDDCVEFVFQTYCSKNYLAHSGSGPVNYTGTISFSEVQIEEGAQATLFDKRMPEVELDMCQRYFETGYLRENKFSLGNEQVDNRLNYCFVKYKTKKKTFDKSGGDTWVPDPELNWDNLVRAGDQFVPGSFDENDLPPDTLGHTVKHAIHGIDTVPDHSTGITSGIIAETQPEGFTISYNAISVPTGFVTLRGIWMCEAELYLGASGIQ